MDLIKLKNCLSLCYPLPATERRLLMIQQNDIEIISVWIFFIFLRFASLRLYPLMDINIGKKKKENI